MEQYIKIVIYIHAFLGGIGLLTGILIVITRKGNVNHKKIGKLFTVNMLLSILISLVVTTLPNHENLFLFLIGTFTIYLIIAGNRALKFKTKLKANTWDWLISGTMLFSGLVMIIIGMNGFMQNRAVLFLIFGTASCLLSLADFRFYKQPKRYKNGWLMAHVGKMMGAFIASVTAFIVAGLNYTTLIAWIAPSLIGTPYIIYWIRKLKKGV